MTSPEQDRTEPTPQDEASGETGALAAASQDTGGSDPLAPLNAVTEADQD